MSQYRTRMATMGDTFALYELNKECLPLYYQPLEYMIMLMSSSYPIIVIENPPGDLIGYCTCEFQDNNRCHILSIGVKKDLRKQGLGKNMLDYLTEEVKDKSKFISLYVHVENQTGISFYKKNNFTIKEEKINYYDEIDGFKSKNAYFMIKQIN